MSRAIKNCLVILLLGIAFGVFTSFGQTYIPNPFKQLANSYSVWLFASFIGGLLISSKKWSAVGGGIIQLLAIFTYGYVSYIRFGITSDMLSANILWICGGIIVGPLGGMAGYFIRHKTNMTPYAIALVASLFISEGIYQVVVLGYIAESIVFVLIGILFLCLMLIREERRVFTICVTLALAVIEAAAYALVLPLIFKA